MPPVRRRRSRSRKTYRRKKSNYAKKGYQLARTRSFANYPYVNQNFGAPTFPKKMNCVFRWSEGGNGLVLQATSPTTPSNATLSVRANSLQDPGDSIFSKQPRFLDTLCGANGTNAVYSRYFVKAFAIDVQAYITTATNFCGNMSITLRSQDSSPPGTLDECYTRYDTKVVSINPPGSGDKMAKISHYGTVKDIFAVGNVSSQDQFKSLYSTNPVKAVWADIAFWNSDNTQNVQMYYQVTLRQYSTLYSLNDVIYS